MSPTPPNEPIPGQRGDEPPDGAGATAQPGPLTPPEDVSAEDFEASYGEPLERTLDLETWARGENLDRMFARLDQELSEALEQEDDLCQQIRQLVFPQIARRPNAPPGAGVFQATVDQLKTVQQDGSVQWRCRSQLRHLNGA